LFWLFVISIILIFLLHTAPVYQTLVFDISFIPQNNAKKKIVKPTDGTIMEGVNLGQVVGYARQKLYLSLNVIQRSYEIFFLFAFVPDFTCIIGSIAQSQTICV